MIFVLESASNMQLRLPELVEKNKKRLERPRNSVKYLYLIGIFIDQRRWSNKFTVSLNFSRIQLALDMMRTAQTIVLNLIFLCILFHSQGQSYSCANSNTGFLERALGEWKVATKDRIAVDEYEENNGTAIVSRSIEGCGISISFRGTYKKKPYAREAIITGLDSVRIQMVSMDSEHGGFLTYDGQLVNDTLKVTWYRNKEKGKLISMHKLYFIDTNVFDFSSFLSTDYGKTWALTHQRLFEKEPSKPTSNFFAVIVRDLDTSIDWYSKVLGFTVVNRNTLSNRGTDVANLENGKNRLELIQLETSLSPFSVLESKQKMQGLFKIGFSVDDIESYIATLRSINPDFDERVVTDPVSEKSTIVFKDPDGNRVQLFEE